MPFIEESDLLELHKDIDKAQLINERLLDQIKIKDKALRNTRIQRNVWSTFTILFAIGALAIYSYNDGFIRSSKIDDRDNLFVSVDSMEIIKSKIDNLKEQNEELSSVKEFYLAKKFLEKETIYSVQIKSFLENNVALASESLGNTIFVKTNPFYSYSLGNFETLEEAQSFRYQLVKMGFQDAFVASYRDGKRVEIENPY